MPLFYVLLSPFSKYPEQIFHQITKENKQARYGTCYEKEDIDMVYIFTISYLTPHLSNIHLPIPSHSISHETPPYLHLITP